MTFDQSIQGLTDISPTTNPVAACASPSSRAWPVQYLEFRREITSDQDPAMSLPNIPVQDQQLVNVHVRGSVLAKFVQQWSLGNVLIGDFANLLSLAPSEVLTIEMMRTQHTLLEQSQESTSSVETGTENLNSDKESINIANTSARTANWGVSGSGGFSMSGIGVSGSATDNHTLSQNTTSTINSIHDTTLKSTQKVMTQTKLQIRGVTETTVEARQTRVLKNPFPDRVLHLNLYELVKQFSVRTSQDALQLMVTASLDPLTFTQAFVSSNRAFLQDALLDPELQSDLPNIVTALEQAKSNQEQAQINNALDTLEKYLFEDRPGVQPYHHSDTNNDTPTNAFTNADVNNPGKWTDINTGASGVAIGLSVSAGFEIYANLQMYWMIMAGYPSGSPTAGLGVWPTYSTQRLQLMQAIAGKIRDAWEGKLDDAGRKSLMSSANRTEIFRRIPGFLKLYDELLGTLTIAQPDPTTVTLVNALLNHLNSSKDYYTEQFLRFLWNRLGKTYVIRFVNTVLSTLFPSQQLFPQVAGYDMGGVSRPYLNLYEVEKVERNGLNVMIPLTTVPTLDPANTTISKPLSTFIQGLSQLQGAISQAAVGTLRQDDNVLVPTEGVYMEPVAGSCVLQLPAAHS